MSGLGFPLEFIHSQGRYAGVVRDSSKHYDRDAFVVKKNCSNGILSIRHQQCEGISVNIDIMNGVLNAVSDACANYCREMACPMANLQNYVYDLTREINRLMNGEPQSRNLFGSIEPEQQLINFMLDVDLLLQETDNILEVLQIRSEFIANEVNSSLVYDCKIAVRSRCLALDSDESKFWVKVDFRGDPFLHLDMDYVYKFRLSCLAAIEKLKQHAYACIQVITHLRSFAGHCEVNCVLDLRSTVDFVASHYWEHSFTQTLIADDVNNGEFDTIRAPEYPF